MDMSIIYLLIGVLCGGIFTFAATSVYRIVKRDELEINTDEVDYDYESHIKGLDIIINTIVEKIVLYKIVTKPSQSKLEYITGDEFQVFLSDGCKELLETISDAYREVLFRYYSPDQLDRVMCEKLKTALLIVCLEKNLVIKN